MSLINISLLPHSPLLIPEIGRANYHFLGKTTAAYETIGQKLKEAEVETIIIISPHVVQSSDHFSINIAPEMIINLQDFGFIPTKKILVGDTMLAENIKNALRPTYNIDLISEPILDHGSAIPAYLLKELGLSFKLIVVAPADNLDLEEQSRFGQALNKIINESEKKVAIIASGDLSHRLKRKSPGGYSPKGAKFDNKLIEYLNDSETALHNILQMDKKLIEGAGECGLKPTLIALGILEGQKWQPEVLAYQTDFGIGYLSFSFQLS